MVGQHGQEIEPYIQVPEESNEDGDEEVQTGHKDGSLNHPIAQTKWVRKCRNRAARYSIADYVSYAKLSP